MRKGHSKSTSESSSKTPVEAHKLQSLTSPGGASKEKKPSTLTRYHTIFKTAAACESEVKETPVASSILHKSVIFAVPYDPERRNLETSKLLLAVVYGRESAEANIPIKAGDAGNLFHAKDLLQTSPGFLLERGDVTDDAGRTFKSITAFEYALWAKDFKMIEMMLSCIPSIPQSDEIRSALLEQFKQVTAPLYAGGGLTYELTYNRPVQDANGIPLKDDKGAWQTTFVTEVHTESHFNLNPLINAYIDYESHFDFNADGSQRTWAERDACWVKGIGTLQFLLPVNMLQRYCDPDTPFYPLSQTLFTGVFKRTMQYYNFNTPKRSLYLSSDFSLVRGGDKACIMEEGDLLDVRRDLEAIRQLDKVSTEEIEKIKQQLTTPQQSPSQFCP